MHLIINLGELVHSLTRLIYFISDTVCVMLCAQFITISDLKVEHGFTCSGTFTFCSVSFTTLHPFLSLLRLFSL